MIGTANAALISVSEQQNTTEDGQLFSFNFDSLAPSDGTGGLLSISLTGDYSPRNPPPLSEGATLSLNGVAGFVELYNNSSSAAIFSNSITGLSIASSSFSGGGNSTELGYTFDISSALLDAILADGSVLLSVQNTTDVGFTFGSSFVGVGIEYNSDSLTAPVSAPTTLLMFAAVLGGFVIARRK